MRWHDTVIRYGEFGALVDEAHRALVAAGVERDSRICLVAPKSPSALALLVAAWRTGTVVLLPAWDLGDTALHALAARAGVRQIVRLRGSGRHARSATAVARGATPSMAGAGGVACSGAGCEPIGPLGIDVAVEPAHPSTERSLEPDLPAGTLLLLTTSGSTGAPKIVPISPAGADRFFAWAATAFEIGGGARVLSYAPLNFDLSLLDVWAALAHGAQTVLIDPARATEPGQLARMIAVSRATVVQAVPMVFRLLVEAAGRTAGFDAVRHVLLTGDVTPPTVLSELPRLFPDACVYNVYGCTETNDSILHEVRSFAVREEGRLAIGRPLPGVETRLVAPSGGVMEGPGSGELWVSTPFQASGYLDPALTAERFVPDPLGSGATFYRTGDIVSRDADGVFTLEGRDDFHVKVRGVRTNTAEVEHVMLDHPDVLEAAVLPVPDEIAGHLLHAVVRRRRGSRLNSLVLRQACAERLVRTAIPTGLTIVDEPLPKTSTGKLDRNTIENFYLRKESR